MKTLNRCLLTLFVLGVASTGCLKDDDDGPNTNPCMSGESRSADDDCNTCLCTDEGVWECTTEVCLPAECTEDECGPRPQIPDQVCADGTTAGIGDCTRNQDGTCGWTRTECPPICEPGEELSQFDGNDCICNGAGQFECLCDSESPGPSCICSGEGEWLCENPAICSESQPCTAQYDNCGCEWVCSSQTLPTANCDVECEDSGPAPMCACENGTCLVDDPATCEDSECEVYVDTCSCTWACDDGSDVRPACERECAPEELGPMPSCGCDGESCALETSLPDECRDDSDCQAYFDTCRCEWGCSSDPDALAQCDQVCPDLDASTAIACECKDGECSSAAACVEGETRDAEDGCNTCRCVDGSWACTELGCANECQDASGCEPFYDSCSCDWTCIVADENPVTCARACPPDNTPPPECTCEDGQCAAAEAATCQDGETTNDGCNTCACSNGEWRCTLRFCPDECEDGDTRMEDCNSCICDNGQWACTELVCPEACSLEDCPGEGPLVPTQACDDGTTAGPECERNLDGDCAWVITMCPPGVPPGQACTQDADCQRTGCSGTICASAPVVTTCQALPEHACYQSARGITDCGCNNGICAWSNPDQLNMCIEDTRQNGPNFPPGRPQ